MTLTNTGVDPLTISTVTVAGLDPTEFAAGVNCVGQTLNPGGTCQIGVTFDPAAIGLRSATLRVTHTGLNNPLEVGLTGVGSVGTDKPNLTFTPRSLAFAPVHIGRNSSIATLTVSNPAATQALTINDVRITNDLGGAFQIVNNRCQPQTAPGLPTGDPGLGRGRRLLPGRRGVLVRPGRRLRRQARGRHARLPAHWDDARPEHADQPERYGFGRHPAVSTAVDAGNGFPRWYQDSNGIRLQPCLQTTNCVLLADAGFNRANPVAFPTTTSRASSSTPSRTPTS